METDERELLSHFSPNTSTLIRKLRKKLRQIEKLERVERELTEEEEIKLDTKEGLREELQSLLCFEERKMVKLTEGVEKTSITKTQSINDNAVLGMVEEKMGYEVSGKIISHEVNSNGSDLNSDYYSVKEECMSDDVVINDSGTDDAGEVSKKASENDESVDNGKMIKDEFGAEDLEEAAGKEHRTPPPPTPTITKRSLRQRIRVKAPGAAPVAVPVEAVVTVDPKHMFSDMAMATKLLEGSDICAVDLDGDNVITGGRDTTVKLWCTSSEVDVKSLGGHSATVTCVKFLKDKPHQTYPGVVSGSYDCSVRVWDLDNRVETKCIYVYSPVVCMDYVEGKVAIGTEGGKVEVYDVETGVQWLSVQAHGDAVSAVKVLPGDKVSCGSTDGVLKIFNISIAQTDPIFALDPQCISIKQASESDLDSSQTKAAHTLSMSKITCITSWKDMVIYGDEGFNIKVLDHKKGEVTKVRNNLQEFCPTEALAVTTVQGTDCLFSVGSDVDMGDAYINIRALPDLHYFGTIRDGANNTGSITSLSVQYQDNCLRLLTGGQQLRVWDQTQRRAKKRKSDADDDCRRLCKYNCDYTFPKDSEPESETDESSQSKSSKIEESGSQSGSQSSTSTEKSWCILL